MSHNAIERGHLKKIIPGGVDGNAKYFAGMPVVKSAHGCRLVDLDGKEYIDYCCGYGPLIFGPLAHSPVNA